jgi:serine/threonine protein kinase
MMGLEFIHLKQENLVLDERCYVHITDFGIARFWSPENSKDTSGTPGYMGNIEVIKKIAPEVMCRHNHGVAVDYYALGVITYECMFGRRPYVGKG